MHLDDSRCETECQPEARPDTMLETVRERLKGVFGGSFLDEANSRFHSAGSDRCECRAVLQAWPTARMGMVTPEAVSEEASMWHRPSKMPPGSITMQGE